MTKYHKWARTNFKKNEELGPSGRGGPPSRSLEIHWDPSLVCRKIALRGSVLGQDWQVLQHGNPELWQIYLRSVHSPADHIQ